VKFLREDNDIYVTGLVVTRFLDNTTSDPQGSTLVQFLYFTTVVIENQFLYNESMKIILIILLSYLLGSIPFGVVIASLFRIDITKHGSGNIGATNVMRTLGIVPGSIVLILDLLKGTLATGLAMTVLKDPLLVIICGLAAILGHMFSVFLKFKGGKGAAVGLGVLLAIAPDIFLFTTILTIIIVSISRYVSLASIIGPVITTLLLFIFDRPLPYSIASALVAVLMLYKHIPNIKRLLAGTENKIGSKKNG